MEIIDTNGHSPISNQDERQYAMFIHLSQLAGLIVPILGWLVPLILWQVKKDTSAYINTNGKIVMNWIISSLIYAVVCYILVLILVGFLLLIALGICYLVFIIIGSIKASNGEIWHYPLSIRFIK